MFKRLANWLFGAAKEPQEFKSEPMSREDTQNPAPDRIRRWESAETTRLNAHQWCGVNATAINSDIEQSLETLVARCRHERYNNPMVEGVLSTWANDVVGQHGPTLIVESDDEEYDRVAKQVWDEWFAKCEVTGIPGSDLLRRLVMQDGDTGDWLQQKIDLSTELPASEPVKTRLLDIDPLRLSSPPQMIGKSNVVMGIERDRLGRPKTYFVRNPRDQFLAPYFDWSLNYDPIPAGDMLHAFHSREPGQVRGFPRLASCLQEIADLRDFDYQVMDAARTAANNGMLLWTTQPELCADHARVFQGTIRLERQVAKAVPPGYQVSGQTSTQPTAHYIDFRHEKLRSLGRSFQMPLLMVLLSAEDSNFSQSRIDLNVIYQRAVDCEHQWVAGNWLNPLRDMIFREAGLAFAAGKTSRDTNPFLLPPRPKNVVMRWGWEPIAQANPVDHTRNQTERIAWGLTSPARELSRENLVEDEVLDSIAKSNKKRAARNLPPLPGPAIAGQPQQGTNDAKAEQNQTPKAGANGKGKKAAAKRSSGRRAARRPANA